MAALVLASSSPALQPGRPFLVTAHDRSWLNAGIGLSGITGSAMPH